MNCLAPSITHSPSSSVAVVRTLPASEPASGSVRPKAASRSPLQSCGSHSAFCSSRPPEVDRHRPQRGVGGHRDADRGVDPGQLLDRQRVGEGVGAAAAVLLREGDPHQPQLAHLGDDLVGEALRRGPAPRPPARPPGARNPAPCRAAASARRSAEGPPAASYVGRMPVRVRHWLRCLVSGPGPFCLRRCSRSRVARHPRRHRRRPSDRTRFRPKAAARSARSCSSPTAPPPTPTCFLGTAS